VAPVELIVTSAQRHNPSRRLPDVERFIAKPMTRDAVAGISGRWRRWVGLINTRPAERRVDAQFVGMTLLQDWRLGLTAHVVLSLEHWPASVFRRSGFFWNKDLRTAEARNGTTACDAVAETMF